MVHHFLVLGIDSGYLLTQILNGLMFGMTLVLISIGLSIIFGTMGIINFAHGDILLVGTYVAWMLTVATGSIAVGIVGAGLVTAILGMGIERFTLRYTYGHGPLLQLLLTFGLAELLRGTVQIVWGRLGKNFATPTWGAGSVDLVLLTYPAYRLFVIGVAAALVVATYLFITRTDIGLIIRAGTQNRQMVDALGIDVSKMFLIVFAIGAGIAGALIGPIFGVYPTLGVEFLIIAFVVVIVGGVGSFRGSIVAGLLIGQVVVLTGVLYSPASDVIVYVLMAGILLLRPRGLFGKEGVIG